MHKCDFYVWHGKILSWHGHVLPWHGPEIIGHDWTWCIRISDVQEPIRVVKMCWNAGFYGVGTIKIFFLKLTTTKILSPRGSSIPVYPTRYPINRYMDMHDMDAREIDLYKCPNQNYESKENPVKLHDFALYSFPTRINSHCDWRLISTYSKKWVCQKM